MPPRQIYLLSPKELGPETIAVAFAKTSRSPESFREIAAELSDEKSAKFHEKWVVGYGHACYDEATEVLTEEGWYCWSDLSRNWQQNPDKAIRLATLNPATGLVEYQPPRQIIAKPYSGPMYKVRARAVDLLVTPNHRMWVCVTRTRKGRLKQDYQLIPASALDGVPCVYQLSARWEGPEPTTLQMGGQIISARALMRLTGFFIGDGYHDPRYHDAVSFNLRKNREISFLRQVVADCGYKWTMHGSKHYVTGPGLGEYLDICYDQRRRKIIPPDILRYGPALLHSLMEGFLHSDGGIYKNNAIYDTTSETLKDQMYELAIKIGWAAFAVPKIDRRDNSRQTLYRVYFNQTRLKPEINKVRYRKQDGWEIYDGMVFCAEMPRNHILYVRRNGRAVWSGNSVAEHAVLHIAIENVSRLAVESIESNRLASYTEKSTRYQKWGKEDFYIPPELDGHPLRENYIQTCRLLFDTYTKSLAPVRELIERQFPPRDTVRAANTGGTPVRDGSEAILWTPVRDGNESEEAYDRRIRSQYVDSCRFLLPAASLANLGMTANARVLENAIRKMRSHPLAEVRQIGEEIKRVAQGEVPTLVKYAEAVPYLTETSEEFYRGERKERGENHRKISANSALSAVNDWCTLIDYDPDGETKVLAAALYRFGMMTYAQALQMVRSAPEPERVKLAESLLGRLGEHDTPLRELEYTSYTFELILDQGAYAEFKRHRMMTQTPQALTARLGYALPRRIAAAGFEVPYRSVMESAAEMYERMAAWNPQVAAYLVPNGFNRRVLFTMNLREAFAFCQLRAAENAHFSIRRVALRVAEEIRRVHPLLAKYLHLPEGETWRTIEECYFAATK